MNLYLMRHAQAEDGPREDPTRTLTSTGRRQAQAMGEFLARQIGRVDIVITSYFARALATAAPVAESLGCELIIDTPMLEPTSTAADAMQEIRFLAGDLEDVLVVSHHPLIGDLLEYLTGTKTREEHFGHAAVAAIDGDRLRWFVTPDLVERDEDQVIEAAITLTEQLAAEVREAKRSKTGGLAHPTHQVVIGPARTKLKKVFAGYFARQGKAILAAVEPHITSVISQFTETGGASMSAEQFREDGGEWVTINGHPVLIGGGAEGTKERVERAKKSAVRTGQASQAIADKSEQVLSDAIGLPRTADNSPFDLRNDDVGIEVKTLVNGKNEKITMSKAALGRKLAEQRADELKAYTVVVDRRTGGLTGKATYYVKEGLGSFRLGSMTKISLSDLKAMVKP